jgi:hypothetical protein
MDIDVVMLRWAKPANLQRLARSLNVDLPPIRRRRLDDWKKRAAAIIRARMEQLAKEDVATRLAGAEPVSR